MSFVYNLLVRIFTARYRHQMQVTMKIDVFYDKAYAWILDRGPSVLLGLGVLFVGFWLIKMLAAWMNRHLFKKEVDPSLTPFLLSLTVVVLRVLLVVSAMQIIGIQMTVFAALIGAVGVAAGLALSGTLQNFTSGILILLLKPFRVGDNIIAQGQEGTVTAIKIFHTIVTTYDNKAVIVPNSKLSNEVIINTSGLGTRRIDIELKFNNSIDFERVRNIVKPVIDHSTDATRSAENRIGISSLEPDGYKVMINVWVDAHGFIDAKMKVQEEIMNTLIASGLKLPGLA
jgi:small conductance mechanosensitive channel